MTQNTDPVGRAIGWLLVVLGGLWLFLTGSCALMLAGASQYTNTAPGGSVMSGPLGWLVVFAVVGLLPSAVLLWAGTTLLRARRRDAPANHEPDA